METFSALFGINQESVQRNCLLLPFLSPGILDVFGIKSLARGVVFSSANANNITIIKTGMGAGFVGDAVMYLANSPCQNIFFLGSCGLIDHATNLNIGQVILPETVYGFESFSDILNDRLQPSLAVRPDHELINQFLKTTSLKPYSCGCVSFGSLHQEEQHLTLFKALDVEVIEMECAALFNAAVKTNKRALALLYISDILGDKRFYANLDNNDKEKLAQGADQAALAIRNFTNYL